jgi:hypothetical protein
MPFDTFRRGGFGHAILGSRHAPLLTIERGISLGWLDTGGTPRARYAAGLYEPRPRFRIPADANGLASAQGRDGESSGNLLR